jgi:polycomb protein EED
MSSGIDHLLKMWNINKDNVRRAIEQSDKFKQVNIKSFKTELINFPDFATRDVHYNYIDCVRWHNNLILSKSIENKIILRRSNIYLEKETLY